MALVRKEAGKRQDEVSAGCHFWKMAAGLCYPQKTGGRPGQRCLADTLSPPEVLGWGVGKENEPLTFAPHP